MKTLALCVVVLAGGCVVDSDYGGTMFRCELEAACPDGFSCVGGICITGTSVVDAAPGADGSEDDGGECPLLGLSDDFEDDAIGSLWTTYGQVSVSEATGTLQLTPATAPNPREGGIRSASQYDVTGKQVAVEVVEMVELAEPAARAVMSIGPTDMNRYSLAQQAGTLHAEVAVDGIPTILESVTYDSGAHRWWRIRHDGSDVVLETSSAGVEWDELARSAAESFMTAARVQLSVETSEMVTAPGTVQFDNLNRGAGASCN